MPSTRRDGLLRIQYQAGEGWHTKGRRLLFRWGQGHWRLANAETQEEINARWEPWRPDMNIRLYAVSKDAIDPAVRVEVSGSYNGRYLLAERAKLAAERYIRKYNGTPDGVADYPDSVATLSRLSNRR